MATRQVRITPDGRAVARLIRAAEELGAPTAQDEKFKVFLKRDSQGLTSEITIFKISATRLDENGGSLPPLSD